MIRLLLQWFTNRPRLNWGRSQHRPFRHWRQHSLGLLLCVGALSLGMAIAPTLATAQSDADLRQQENQLIREFSLPSRPAPAPVYRPRPNPAPAPARSNPPAPRPAAASPAPADPAPAAPATDSEAAEAPEAPEVPPLSQYVLEFNRSPVVGNRLRLQGVYPETRLGFTRPRDWTVEGVRALLRFQHSPDLIADRSFLTLRLQDTSIGSVALNQVNSEIAEATFDIPPNLLQDYNELSIVAEQHSSDTCTNPADPMLWTEILPDSKLVFDYRPKPLALNFSQFPAPFIDDLSIEPNRLAYLQPSQYSDGWLSSVARFQVGAARLSGSHALETHLVDELADLQWGDRLIIIGTPAEQPLMADLELPFDLEDDQILDGDGNPLPDDEGVLMLSTVEEGSVPVLVVSGNGAEGVVKAAQSLVQPQDLEIQAGQVLLVNGVSEVSSPSPRNWPGYLPADRNSFPLRDLTLAGNQPFQDVTVRGTTAPPIRVPFHALPDDAFQRGSTMRLRYSHSPLVNPRTSSVDVLLDDVTISSKRLGAWSGGRKSFKLELPPNLIQPDSVLTVQFVMHPREQELCGPSADQQLWGTLHGDTQFDLNRHQSVRLPDLKLLQTGFPLTAPQDLSQAAIVLPDTPTDADVRTLLAVSQRLGAVSQANSVKLAVYRAGNIPGEERDQRHLIAIGERDRFPIPEAIAPGPDRGGFSLAGNWMRLWNGSQVQAFPDNEGVIKAVLSPQNPDRIILALVAQSDEGLTEIQDVFSRDALFSQLYGDTVLIRRNEANPSAYDASGYTLTFLSQSPQRQIQQVNSLSGISQFLQDYWFLLPTGIVLLTLLLYGISQVYVNRLGQSQPEAK
ncbi:MAG: cellulose biosynthesis cyclic di-GMP-binding regulatory protein BcsB [Elainellaceae cyanobacterium]